MGRVLTLGLDSLGTGKSIRLNDRMRSSMQKLLCDANLYGNAREKKHAKAVNFFAHGYVLAFYSRCSSRILLGEGERTQEEHLLYIYF